MVIEYLPPINPKFIGKRLEDNMYKPTENPLCFNLWVGMPFGLYLPKGYSHKMLYLNKLETVVRFVLSFGRIVLPV